MDALEILDEVRRCGGDVKLVAPNRLRVVAPVDRLPDLVSRVRMVKPRLLAVLAEPAIADGGAWCQLLSDMRAALVADGKPERQADLAAWWWTLERWYVLHGRRFSP